MKETIVAFTDDEPIKFDTGSILAQISYSTEKDLPCLDIVTDSGFLMLKLITARCVVKINIM